MLTNIAIPQRAINRICDSMHSNICIRMPQKRMIMWNFDTI